MRLRLLRSFFGAFFVVVFASGGLGCSGLSVRDDTDSGSSDAGESDAGAHDAGRTDAPAVDGSSCDCPCAGDRCEEGQCVPAEVVRIASLGPSHTCVVTETNALYCWGNNNGAELGTGERGEGTERLVPTAIAPATAWLTVSAGFFHTCAMANDQSLWCWGSDAQGRLGVGDTLGRNEPTMIAGSWWQVSAGNGHTCGVRIDGTLWCWGDNGVGQLGQGNVDDRVFPAQVGTATDWREVMAAGTRTCAMRTDGTLWCWGYGTNGELGLGAANNAVEFLVPQRVGSATNWGLLSRGVAAYHTCATRADRTLWCWGANEGGRTGLGGTGGGSAMEPTEVVDVTDPPSWTRVTTGFDFSCAALGDRTGWCFGNNDEGKLGTSDTMDRTEPTKLPDVAAWADIVGGAGHTCGVTTAGALWCWGGNHRGQLGMDDRETRMTPTRVCLPSSDTAP